MNVLRIHIVPRSQCGKVLYDSITVLAQIGTAVEP